MSEKNNSIEESTAWPFECQQRTWSYWGQFVSTPVPFWFPIGRIKNNVVPHYTMIKPFCKIFQLLYSTGIKNQIFFDKTVTS